MGSVSGRVKVVSSLRFSDNAFIPTFWRHLLADTWYGPGKTEDSMMRIKRLRKVAIYPATSRPAAVIPGVARYVTPRSHLDFLNSGNRFRSRKCRRM